MDLYKKVPYQHEENLYEIRIHYQENLINIVTFLDNYPANGFRYQIQLPKHVDIEKFLDEKYLSDFIEKAKKDIVDNLWSHFARNFV
jgi:hypothetical protein